MAWIGKDNSPGITAESFGTTQNLHVTGWPLTVVLGTPSDPYANHMDIGASFIIGDARVVEFICNIATEGLTELAMAVAPELAGPEALKEFEFESMCQQLSQAIGA